MNSRAANLILLAICLGLLGTLGFTLYLLRKHPAYAGPSIEQVIITNILTQTQIEVRKLNASNLLAALANRPLSWGGIESTNYQIYMKNLRTFGCPEETIKDIILADVAKLYARRRAALLGEQPDEYWRPQHLLGGDAGLSGEVAEQLHEFEMERNRLVQQLLNVDFESEMAKLSGQGADEHTQSYGFLPAEKREQVAALRRQYAELRQAVYTRSRGLLLEEDEAQLDRIAQEEEKELTALLSPEELAEHELRNSAAAAELRSNLAAFQPTEQEFREIYRLRKVTSQTLAQAFSQNEQMTPEARERAERAAQGALGEELKQALGERRYAEYSRSQDEDYQNLRIVTERLQLPANLAARVYEMKQEANRQREKIESSPSLTPDQRTKALLAMARETEKSVTEAMGEKAYKAYRGSGAGWIEGLRESALDIALAEEEAALENAAQPVLGPPVQPLPLPPPPPPPPPLPPPIFPER